MKNRFALCFRPVGIETEDAEYRRHMNNTDHDRDGDVAECKSIVVSNRKLAAGNLGSASPKFSCHPRPKTGSRKALSRLLKSILFETSPGIRIGDGNIRQIAFLQSNDISSNMVGDKSTKMKERDSVNVQPVFSSSFSSTTSSSSSSTASVSTSSESNHDDPTSMKKRALARSRSNSFDQKKKPKTTKTKLDKTCSSKEDIILYLIVLALFAIIWGKLSAVLFTSLCLYIIPMVFSGFYWRSEIALKLPEKETSKEQKKRVIMEGLLERKPIQRALNL